MQSPLQAGARCLGTPSTASRPLLVPMVRVLPLTCSIDAKGLERRVYLGILGQSDWTRYSKTPNAALFGQAITAPLAITLTALCGVVITSASATIYGEYLWNPFELLIRVQQSFTPAARAGTFFAGCGLAASQLMLCIALVCYTILLVFGSA